MSVKSRLDYFLMRGGLLVKGDAFYNIHGDLDIVRSRSEAETCNDPSEHDNKRFINSFAPRESNGSQPVPDDFPVIAGDGWKVFAKYINWTSKPAWKPDFEKLIEQQIEYDKQQEQPIEELMINAKGNNMPVYTQEMKEAGEHAPIGSKVQTVNTSSFDLEYGDDILGLEVTVRSEPVPTSGGFVQVVEHENIAYCFETDMIFPFKSKEEIEMEEAKKEQVKYISKNYLLPQHVALQMQNNGDLAEIILPLESNK